MKKLIGFLTIMIISFGCGDSKPCEMYDKSAHEISKDEVTHLTYANHDYLRFGVGNCAWGVHDPDCKNSIHSK